VAQKFHFAILQIDVTRASCGLSAIAELLVIKCQCNFSLLRVIIIMMMMMMMIA